MGVEAILAIGGLVVPPLFHFFKGLFLPDKADDPESTMSTLAINKPEVLPEYVKALAGWLEAQSKHFNRDVIGTPRQWIIDMRAGIRPSVTVIGVVALVIEGMVRFFFPTTGPMMDPGTRGLFILTTSSWFGGKVLNGN
jgi:hypothetical protein